MQTEPLNVPLNPLNLILTTFITQQTYNSDSNHWGGICQSSASKLSVKPVVFWAESLGGYFGRSHNGRIGANGGTLVGLSLVSGIAIVCLMAILCDWTAPCWKLQFLVELSGKITDFPLCPIYKLPLGHWHIAHCEMRLEGVRELQVGDVLGIQVLGAGEGFRHWREELV